MKKPTSRTGKTREEIITAMCMTWRHDFGLHKNASDPEWTAGMTPQARENLWLTMAQIFDNDIAPHVTLNK